MGENDGEGTMVTSSQESERIVEQFIGAIKREEDKKVVYREWVKRH